jgi:hypothetical protein
MTTSLPELALLVPAYELLTLAWIVIPKKDGCSRVTCRQARHSQSHSPTENRENQRLRKTLRAGDVSPLQRIVYRGLTSPARRYTLSENNSGPTCCVTTAPKSVWALAS